MLRFKFSKIIAVSGLVFAGMQPIGAAADTLADALVRAYQQSPLMEASRAQLRATDEGVAQARARRRPLIDLNGSYSHDASGQDYLWRDTDTSRASLDVSLVLYDHGQSAAALEAAKALVSVGRADLKAQEQFVLGSAVSAYADVLRDIEFVKLSRQNVSVLDQQVQASQDRFDVGEVTRTDVSLAQARKAAAEANLAVSLGQLEISRETYRAVVGVEPNNLSPLPPLPDLPNSLAEAEAIAMRENPNLIASRFAELAADFDLRRARGAIGPSLTLNGNVSTQHNRNAFDEHTTTQGAGIGVRGNLPIYQGGSLSSLVRQAQQILARRKFEVQNSARIVRQDTAFSWANLLVSRASISASQRQIEAARITYEGVVEEAKLGARTTLDVLDREQELRDALFAEISAKRDEYVAAYDLLASMGLLTVQHLNLGIPTYDPGIYYSQAERAPYGVQFDGSVVDKIRSRWAQ